MVLPEEGLPSEIKLLRRAPHKISSADVNDLSPKWVFTTGADVSATPTVAGDAVYFPDWEGNLFAVKKQTADLIWSHKISEYDGVVGAISRVSPAGGFAATSVTSACPESRERFLLPKTMEVRHEKEFVRSSSCGSHRGILSVVGNSRRYVGEIRGSHR
jgi:hypothetical protein